jgi:hypothetical protein
MTDCVARGLGTAIGVDGDYALDVIRGRFRGNGRVLDNRGAQVRFQDPDINADINA